MAFETDPSSVDYNAMATVEEMDAIVAFQSAKFDSDFGYSVLVDAAKQSFIVSASQSLAVYKFNGTRIDAILPQAYKMSFPRTGLKYPGTDADVDVGGDPYINPSEVKDYIGLWILSELAKKSSAEQQELKSKTVDGVTETYGSVKREFFVETIVPIEAIPSDWIYSEPSSAGFGGVGSFSITRFP